MKYKVIEEKNGVNIITYYITEAETEDEARKNYESGEIVYSYEDNYGSTEIESVTLLE